MPEPRKPRKVCNFQHIEAETKGVIKKTITGYKCQCLLTRAAYGNYADSQVMADCDPRNCTLMQNRETLTEIRDLLRRVL